MKIYTEIEKQQIIDAYKKCPNYSKVRSMFHGSYATIKEVLIEAGMIYNDGKPKRKLEASPEEVVAQYKKTPSIAKVAEYYGVSISHVYKRMRKIGFHPNNGGFKSIYCRNVRKKKLGVDKFNECIVCGKKYQILHNNPKKKFCSVECYLTYRKNNKNKSKVVKIHKICKVCGKEYDIPKRRSDTNVACSKICFYKLQKLKVGPLSNSWQGGKTKNQLGRCREEIEIWRKNVYERDNYTCKICGVRGGELCAHHILKWVDSPQYRTAVWNGITLCLKDHKKIRGHEREYVDQFIQITMESA